MKKSLALENSGKITQGFIDGITTSVTKLLARR